MFHRRRDFRTIHTIHTHSQGSNNPYGNGKENDCDGFDWNRIRSPLCVWCKDIVILHPIQDPANQSNKSKGVACPTRQMCVCVENFYYAVFLEHFWLCASLWRCVCVRGGGLTWSNKDGCIIHFLFPSTKHKDITVSSSGSFNTPTSTTTITKVLYLFVLYAAHSQFSVLMKIAGERGNWEWDRECERESETPSE